MNESFEENEELKAEREEQNRTAKNVSLNTYLIKILSFSVLLIGITVFYYYVIFLPKQEQAKLDFQIQQEQQKLDAQKKAQQADAEWDANVRASQNRMLLQLCLKNADSAYTFQLNNYCKPQGLNNECTLPFFFKSVDAIEKQRTDAKNNCYKRYPQP
jgi:short subunit fatty acids transporter